MTNSPGPEGRKVAVDDVLADLDLEILKAEARLDALRNVRGLLAARAATDAPGAPPRGAAARHARAKEPAAVPRKVRVRVDLEACRRRVAEHVAANGPAGIAEVRRVAGCGAGTAYSVVDCGHFEREPDGYHLTAEGQQWLASLGSDAADDED